MEVPTQIHETLYAPAERATQELIRHQSGAVFNTANLQKLLGAITDMVILLNQERQIVFANERFLETLGVKDMESVLGLRPGEAVRCMHAFESRGGCGTTEFCQTCGALRAILSAQNEVEDLQECRILQQEGGEALDLLVRTASITIDSDRFTIVAMRDISHEKRRRLLERLFFHDVMNTAVGVRGLSELLSLADAEESGEFQQMIYHGAVHLVDEIKAQRDLTAAENNELRCSIGFVNTLELLKELEELYRFHETGRGRSIWLTPESESMEIQTDRVLLMRVLGNMLKNALEACGEGDTVTVGCDRLDADKVRFRVHNPAHIPRDVQLQIFQRSFSTKGAGRGLGTYSMRLLSERYLKGSVTFESTEESGTTFSGIYPLSCTVETTQEAPGTALER